MATAVVEIIVHFIMFMVLPVSNSVKLFCAWDLRIEGFPQFARELELVSWSDTNWKRTGCFKVNLLAQAVQGNISARKVLVSLFAARDGPSGDHRAQTVRATPGTNMKS